MMAKGRNGSGEAPEHSCGCPRHGFYCMFVIRMTSFVSGVCLTSTRCADHALQKYTHRSPFLLLYSAPDHTVSVLFAKKTSVRYSLFNQSDAEFSLPGTSVMPRRPHNIPRLYFVLCDEALHLLRF